MVRASAWNTQSERETIVGELARAGVDALAEHLFALSAEAPPVGHAAGVLRELEAFASALRDR
jgi:hypothetical protein